MASAAGTSRAGEAAGANSCTFPSRSITGSPFYWGGMLGMFGSIGEVPEGLIDVESRAVR